MNSYLDFFGMLFVQNQSFDLLQREKNQMLIIKCINLIQNNLWILSHMIEANYENIFSKNFKSLTKQCKTLGWMIQK